MSQISFSLNDYVRVRLLPHAVISLRLRSIPMPAENADGSTEWQLWVLMDAIAPLVKGGVSPVDGTELVLIEPSRHRERERARGIKDRKLRRRAR